jgi:hypothetical protein
VTEDLALIRKIGEALDMAIALRDAGVGYRATQLVDALNVCLEIVVCDDLAAAGIEFGAMSHRELLDWYQARSS